MTPIYATNLGFTTQKTSVGIENINSSLLETYGIVFASFLLYNSLRMV